MKALACAAEGIGEHIMRWREHAPLDKLRFDVWLRQRYAPVAQLSGVVAQEVQRHRAVKL